MMEAPCNPGRGHQGDGGYVPERRTQETGECSRGGESGWSGHLQLLKHQSDLLQTKVSAVMEAPAGAVVFWLQWGEGHTPQSCGKGCLLL